MSLVGFQGSLAKAEKTGRSFPYSMLQSLRILKPVHEALEPEALYTSILLGFGDLGF